MDSKTMMKKLERIEDLPTLPTILFEVNRLLEDINTSTKKLGETIGKEHSAIIKTSLEKRRLQAFNGIER
ncbi:MAG: hypothetical protein JRI92_13960 [Deltaproteobacteria bacterium]|nr:hypothetical protein [Deltaproteobacteria bacterium]